MSGSHLVVLDVIVPDVWRRNPVFMLNKVTKSLTWVVIASVFCIVTVPRDFKATAMAVGLTSFLLLITTTVVIFCTESNRNRDK